MLGLIAGNGNFPLIFTKQAKKKGEKVVAVALFDETDKSIENIADKTYWIKVGQLSRLIEILKKENVTKCVMAGQVKHTKLFSVKPDFRAISLLAKLKSKTADSILSAVCDELKKEEIEFLSSATYLSDFIAKKGILTKTKSDKSQKENIEFGYGIAKEIAKLDIGQTVCVKDKSIVAVEAMEGTDECIKRAGEILKKLGKGHPMTVVKVARPNQDMRFDLPVAGASTLRIMAGAGATTLVLEAGKTLILGMDEFFSAAKETGITVFGAENANSFQ